MDDADIPTAGDVLKISDAPEPNGLWIHGVVVDAGRHGDGRLWAKVRYLDCGTPFVGKIEWNGIWEFRDRAWQRLSPDYKATIEFEIALYRKNRPTA